MLIGRNACAEADLAPLKNLVAAVIRFEHPVNSQALVGLIDSLNDWLDGKPGEQPRALRGTAASAIILPSLSCSPPCLLFAGTCASASPRLA